MLQRDGSLELTIGSGAHEVYDVLIILVACAIGVFRIAGWLPDHIARSRNYPYAQAITVAGWITGGTRDV